MDIIYGDVCEVVDGDTFKAQITHLTAGNSRIYRGLETIRIAGINASELNTAAGQLAKINLTNKLSNKHVKLTIQARDTYGRLVCAVELAVKSLR